MSSRIAIIEVFPSYKESGEVDYSLPFSYGCQSMELMGYSDIEELIKKIRSKLNGGKNYER